MATAVGQLITFEEYEKLPEDSGAVYHELRHGELVEVCRPKLDHTRIQKRIERLLEAAAGNRGEVFIEFPFRPNESNVRDADVAYMSVERLNGATGGYAPTPEIVVEVLSPSNTMEEILDKERLCLDTGALEFWVVDLKRHQVKVSTPDGRTVTYRKGHEIPLPLFGAQLSVDAVFA